MSLIIRTIITFIVSLIMVAPISAKDNSNDCAQATLDAQVDQVGYGWITTGVFVGLLV